MASGSMNLGPAGVVGLWEDIIIYPTAMATAAAAPDLVSFNGAGNIKAYGFDGNATAESLYGSFEIPHSYKEGSDLNVHIHWTPSTANAGNVDWFFEYAIANAGAVFGTNATLSTGAVAAGGVAWAHKLSPMSAVIPGAGIKIGAVIAFILSRKPTESTDTYPGDAVLLSAGVHFLQDSAGSSQISTK